MEDFLTTQEKSPLLATHHHLKSFSVDWPCCATKANIDTFCVNCGSLWVEHWKGVIRGNGLYGSLHAYYTRAKYAYLRGSIPLITLYTVCIECCAETELEGEDQIGLKYNYRYNKRMDQEMTVILGYKEVEEMVSSKVIIMQGAFFNANTIDTVGRDGQLRKWELWNPRRILKS